MGCPGRGRRTLRQRHAESYLNYLPRPLAHHAARRWASNVPADQSWETLLRRGFRGATTREVLGSLGAGARYEVLEPTELGFNDSIDLWYRLSMGARRRSSKDVLRLLHQLVKALTGASMTPTLSLAIRKQVALAS